jgi:hypothetical protein
VKRRIRRSWRGAIVASVLALWLTVGIAWGAHAALVFAFFLLIACVYAVRGRLAGGLLRQAGGGYFQRQLDPRRSGRWRGR